ncbi:MAG: hypothetical protein LBV53_00230 [Mycoplasmataceae bacterium]|nr:hypothetical protein [Mycoplasmataceae bacterium]
MAKRIPIEGKTFGRYYVLEYAGYDADKRGAFYLCIDMTNNKRKLMRQDLLVKVDKNWRDFCKEYENVAKFKKEHNLK